jgi:pimeloyl-ACP methyl ester carboxylesterase
MQITLPRPAQISTNVRFLFQTLRRGLALRASALVTPALAGVLAERMFLTPPRPRGGPSAFFDFLDARSSFVAHRGRHIATWRWGPMEAPAVLLVHGWGGTAAQLRGFVAPLLAAGYRVIAYDQPAHGLSEGRLTGLPDFARVVGAVVRHHGGVHAVIAHSLGAAGVAVAMAHGLRLARAVLIAPPSDFIGFTHRFARWHWMPERVREIMQSAIEERFGVRMADLEVSRLAPHLQAPVLVIHDRGDTVMPWQQGEAIARAWPGARLQNTAGLGHHRILKAQTTVQGAVDFIGGRSGVARPATRALPDPAPLY